MYEKKGGGTEAVHKEEGKTQDVHEDEARTRRKGTHKERKRGGRIARRVGEGWYVFLFVSVAWAHMRSSQRSAAARRLEAWFVEGRKVSLQ